MILIANCENSDSPKEEVIILTGKDMVRLEIHNEKPYISRKGNKYHILTYLDPTKGREKEFTSVLDDHVERILKGDIAEIVLIRNYDEIDTDYQFLRIEELYTKKQIDESDIRLVEGSRYLGEMYYDIAYFNLQDRKAEVFQNRFPTIDDRKEFAELKKNLINMKKNGNK